MAVVENGKPMGPMAVIVASVEELGRSIVFVTRTEVYVVQDVVGFIVVVGMTRRVPLFPLDIIVMVLRTRC